MGNRAVFERVSSCHYMDSVDEELGSDSRFLLILAKSEQAHARNDHDRRVRITQLGRFVRSRRLVVLLVFATIVDYLILESRLQDAPVFLCRVPTNEHRTNSGA